MDKKGFTLVEVIVAVLIMLAILLIVVPNVRNILSRNTIKLWKENENRLEEAAKKYVIVKNISIEISASITVTKEQLMDAEIIKEIYDLKDKTKICGAFVIVTNTGADYEANAFINCPGGYQTE